MSVPSHPLKRRTRPLLAPLEARLPDEEHRVATPLELFFDLVIVVAVARAASGLHHALSEGHVAEGVRIYAMVFFGVWWAWVNFTWFASAYDNDDVTYRLLVFVQLTGALIFAAGIGRFEHGDLTVGTLGYVVMRLSLVAPLAIVGILLTPFTGQAVLGTGLLVATLTGFKIARAAG
jgi:low temperature requirement protein LtrA